MVAGDGLQPVTRHRNCRPLTPAATAAGQGRRHASHALPLGGDQQQLAKPPRVVFGRRADAFELGRRKNFQQEPGARSRPPQGKPPSRPRPHHHQAEAPGARPLTTADSEWEETTGPASP